MVVMVQGYQQGVSNLKLF